MKYGLSSAMNGYALTNFILILGHCMQAVGAAMLVVNSPIILTGSYPTTRCGKSFGMVTTVWIFVSAIKER